MATAPSALGMLVAAIDEAFEARAWHGPTLRGSLGGVTARQAAWRPGPRRHNIWELAVHSAYWKYAVRRRLTTAVRPEIHAHGSFAFGGSNWFRRPGGDRTWEEDVRLLVDEHRRLRDTILALSPRALGRRVRGRQTAAFTIRGIAAHDLYHAGQIQLLKRLQRAR